MQTPPGTGQQCLPQRLNGEWRSDRDKKKRREMIQRIGRLLMQNKNASQEWLQKLPQMIKQLEGSLYWNARSFETYADTSTLKHRLHLLAMEIMRKTDAIKSGGSGNGSDGGASPPSAPGGGGGIVNMNINPTMGGSGGGDSRALSPSNQYPSNSQHRRSSSSSQHHRESASPGHGGRQMTEAERDNIVRTRHKQQRLLLLHHASKCTHPEG